MLFFSQRQSGYWKINRFHRRTTQNKSNRKKNLITWTQFNIQYSWINHMNELNTNQWGFTSAWRLAFYGLCGTCALWQNLKTWKSGDRQSAWKTGHLPEVECDDTMYLLTQLPLTGIRAKCLSGALHSQKEKNNNKLNIVSAPYGLGGTNYQAKKKKKSQELSGSTV